MGDYFFSGISTHIILSRGGTADFLLSTLSIEYKSNDAHLLKKWKASPDLRLTD